MYSQDLQFLFMQVVSLTAVGLGSSCTIKKNLWYDSQMLYKLSQINGHKKLMLSYQEVF